MKRVDYPTYDGYIESRDVLFAVYRLRRENSVLVERLEALFRFESEALGLARAIGTSAKIVEVLA